MQNNSKKTTALVTGLLSLIFAVLGFFALWFLAVPALILGIVACVTASQSAKMGEPATGGMVMGILGIVFSGLSLACLLVCASAVAAL